MDDAAADKPVKRCVCGWVTFAEMKEAGVESVEDAQIRFGACRVCGTCRPYIERMIETGETEFEVIEPF